MSIRSEFLIALKEVCRCYISDAVFFNCSQTKFVAIIAMWSLL